MAYSAFNITTSILQRTITQISHGFLVGNIVTYNGTEYVLAQADTLDHAKGAIIVSAVLDLNNFVVTQTGYVSGLSGLVAGNQYYLSSSVAGILTDTPPLTSDIYSPLLVADSTTTGYFFGGTGILLNFTGFTWNIINGAVSSVNMSANQGYINNSSVVPAAFVLPVSASAGDSIKIVGFKGSHIRITERAGQTIYLLANNATITTGTVTQNTDNSVIEIVSVDSGTNWIAFSSMGNFTIV